MAQIETGVKEVDPRHQLDVDRLEQFLRANLDEFEGSLRKIELSGGKKGMLSNRDVVPGPNSEGPNWPN